MKSLITDFTVSGYLPFPMDMLRYDSAWPATSSDATTIHNMLSEHGAYDPTGNRITAIVNLRCHGKGSPTPPRWGSFGWACEVKR